MSDKPTQSTWALGKRLWHDWVMRRPGLLITGLVLSAITAAAAAAYVVLIRETVALIESGATANLWWIPVGAIGLTSVRALSLYLQTLQTNRLALHVMQDLQNAMFAKLVHADFARIQSETVGSLVSRFTNDITLLRETLVRLANNLARDTLVIIGTIGFMLYYDWVLTVLILVVYPIAAYPVIRIGQRLRKTSAGAQEQMGQVTSFLEESFSGTRMVRTYGLENYETERASGAFRDRLRFLFRITENRGRVDPILEAVGGIAFAGVFLIAGWRIASGDTSIANVISILGGIAAISPPIRALGTLNAVVQEGFAVLDRVFGVLDEDEEVAERLEAPALPAGDGELSLADIDFSYPDGTSALSAISMTAHAGKTVALVGPSGSGKSTILNLIPRLYDPQGGQVSIDGTDIRSVSLASLRSQIALVSQDVTLFDDSVRANIAFGRLGAPEEDIIAAAKAADAHDFIMELSDGYDSPVGPRGSNLSGGQRQRLSIARAILKDAPILLLDEATSALDTESERRVQSALETLSRDRTTLVIAHRLSTVRDADWIYVMEDGRICEEGRHEDLLSRDGLYAKLCRMQFGDDA